MHAPTCAAIAIVALAGPGGCTADAPRPTAAPDAAGLDAASGAEADAEGDAGGSDALPDTGGPDGEGCRSLVLSSAIEGAERPWPVSSGAAVVATDEGWTVAWSDVVPRPDGGRSDRFVRVGRLTERCAWVVDPLPIPDTLDVQGAPSLVRAGEGYGLAWRSAPEHVAFVRLGADALPSGEATWVRVEDRWYAPPPLAWSGDLFAVVTGPRVAFFDAEGAPASSLAWDALDGAVPVALAWHDRFVALELAPQEGGSGAGPLRLVPFSAAGVQRGAAVPLGEASYAGPGGLAATSTGFGAAWASADGDGVVVWAAVLSPDGLPVAWPEPVSRAGFPGWSAPTVVSSPLGVTVVWSEDDYDYFGWTWISTLRAGDAAHLGPDRLAALTYGHIAVALRGGVLGFFASEDGEPFLAIAPLPAGEPCPGVVAGRDELPGCERLCEPGSTRACRRAGACTQGTRECDGDGLGWGPCVGGDDLILERCNGVDDDCDGRTDEDAVGAGAPCRAPWALCGRGELVCSGGLLDCVPVAPRGEVCDGQDDDCNGLVDDVALAFPEATPIGDGGGQAALAWTGDGWGAFWATPDWDQGGDMSRFVLLDEVGRPRIEPYRWTGWPDRIRDVDAAMLGGTIGVAWVAGQPGVTRPWFARIGEDGAKIGGDLQVSAEERPAFAPAIAASERGWAAAWRVGTRFPLGIRLAVLDADGILKGEPARDLPIGASTPSAPALAWAGGAWVLAWQERDAAGLMRISEDGEVLGEPVLHALEDHDASVGPPVLLRAGEQLVAVWRVGREAQMAGVCDARIATLTREGALVDGLHTLPTAVPCLDRLAAAWTGPHLVLAWLVSGPRPGDGPVDVRVVVWDGETSTQLGSGGPRGVGEASARPALAWSGERLGLVWSEGADPRGAHTLFSMAERAGCE